MLVSRKRRLAAFGLAALLFVPSTTQAIGDLVAAHLPSPVHLTNGPAVEGPAPTRPVAVNLHNAGDTARSARAAAATRPSMIEVDVSWNGHDLVVDHSLLPRPFTQRAAELEDAWARTRAAQFGFIDAKFRSRAGVEALISFARRHRDRALFVSTPNARVLTEIHTGAPWVHTLLSVCNVGRMRSVLGGHVAVAGLYGFSVNQSLLDPTTTAGLVHRAPFVLAYSVDSMARVRNLSDWGVRGITTDSLPIARALSSAARARGARVV